MLILVVEREPVACIHYTLSSPRAPHIYPAWRLLEKGWQLQQLARAFSPEYSKSLAFKNLLWSFTFHLLPTLGSILTLNLQDNTKFTLVDLWKWMCFFNVRWFSGVREKIRGVTHPWVNNVKRKLWALHSNSSLPTCPRLLALKGGWDREKHSCNLLPIIQSTRKATDKEEMKCLEPHWVSFQPRIPTYSLIQPLKTHTHTHTHTAEPLPNSKPSLPWSLAPCHLWAHFIREKGK